MLDYGEMTSFNFNSMDYKQVQELQKLLIVNMLTNHILSNMETLI